MKEQVEQVVPLALVTPLLSALVLATTALALRRWVSLRAALGFAAAATLWVTFSGVLATSGFLARFDARPPPMFLFMASVLVVSALAGFSTSARGLALSAPLALLVVVQGFRLPLEVAMHHAASLSVLPRELTWSGYNFDVVTGASAFVVAAAVWRGASRPWLKPVVWAWNVVGIAALATIVVVAVLSSPMVMAFGTEPAHVNTFVTTVPHVWLPAVLVVFAVAGHIVVTRALLAGRGDSP